MRELVHKIGRRCGQLPVGGIVTVISGRKSPHHDDMMILPRLIAIAFKKLVQNPDNPRPAVEMLLRNAVRLGVLHLGRGQTQALMRDTLQEGLR